MLHTALPHTRLYPGGHLNPLQRTCDTLLANHTYDVLGLSPSPPPLRFSPSLSPPPRVGVAGVAQFPTRHHHNTNRPRGGGVSDFDMGLRQTRESLRHCHTQARQSSRSGVLVCGSGPVGGGERGSRLVTQASRRRACGLVAGLRKSLPRKSLPRNRPCPAPCGLPVTGAAGSTPPNRSQYEIEQTLGSDY